MKLSTKRILSGIMIAGDLFMMLIGLILIFDEEMFLFGMAMLVLLAIDIYLTIDYIRSLKHREKVEQSLLNDNLHASEIRQRYEEMRWQKKPHSVPRRPKGETIREPVTVETEEEDLSDLLSGTAAAQNQELRQ